MRLLEVRLLLIAQLSVTLAQSSTASALAELPNCALTCLVTAIQHSTCLATNQTCVCTNAPLQDEAALCVSQNCSVKNALVTKNITETICHAPVRDKSGYYNIISIALGVLSGFFILMRLGFKLFVAEVALGLDDWFILATIISGVPSSVITSHGTTVNGLGRDVWTLTPTMITNFGRFFYVMAALYFAQIALLKMSLLFFYLRIFPERNVRRLLWSTIIFNALFGIIFIFTSIFQCAPISFFWENWDGEHTGKCLNINAIAWANAIISIVLDLWMLAIPLSQLRTLQLHWKKKIGVGIMFCTGTFVTAVSILRLQSLVTFASSTNPTWSSWDVSLWSTIEINIGIICACMPTVRLILVRLIPVLGTTHRGVQYYNYNANGSKSGVRSHSRALSGNKTPGVDQAPTGITYQKTYTVRYGENDELSLVQLQDLYGIRKGSSKSRSNASETSM